MDDAQATFIRLFCEALESVIHEIDDEALRAENQDEYVRGLRKANEFLTNVIQANLDLLKNNGSKDFPGVDPLNN